jgi:5'-nucleotidase
MIRKILITILLVFALAHAALAADYVLITLLHTNDLHGNVLASRGGLAKTATLVRQIRAEMPNVLLLDAGDMVHGSYEDYLSGGKATISAMNAVGYSAAATGNHDYDFGPDVVRNITSTATFPMLAANVKDRVTGQTWGNVLPYTILNVSGVKVAVLGLTTLETVTLNWPSTVSEIRVDDPTETARVLVPELRKQADVVVLLSHLGNELDLKLASMVPGIDFIIGGHSHTIVSKWKWVGDTMITQAGNNGRYLGRIDFIASVEEGGAKIMSVNGKNGRLWNELDRTPLDKTYPTSPLIRISSALPDDEAVVEAYKSFRHIANGVLSESIGEALAPVPLTPAESGESPAGGLVADAVRSLAKSDVAVVDSASVVSGLTEGRIRLKHAFGLISGWTRQQIIVVRMKGSDLSLGLSANILRKKALHLQVSGVSLAYKSSGSRRATISGLRVGGLPIDQARDYTVAGQAYVIQEFLKAGPSVQVVSEFESTIREAIALYVRTSKNITPPPAGRITIKQ